MTPQEYGFLIGLVIVFVFIFDAIDLHPQIGSFGFLKSFAYWAYFAIRLVLSSVASLVLAAIQPDLLIPVTAFIGVIASVTVLQSLNLNIGGNEIANVKNLLDGYKTKMISDESERRGARADSSILELVQKLVDVCTVEELDEAVRSMLLKAGWKPDDITKHINDHRAASGNSEHYFEAILANEVAEMNQEYAKKLLSFAAIRHKPPSNE
jgi:hypothetical protein